MEQINIVTVLIICVLFFLILLILGVRKSYKLKAENEKLSKKVTLTDENRKHSKEHNQGHLYGGGSD
jgi:hypothetical protein